MGQDEAVAGAERIRQQPCARALRKLLANQKVSIARHHPYRGALRRSRKHSAGPLGQRRVVVVTDPSFEQVAENEHFLRPRRLRFQAFGESREALVPSAVQMQIR